MPQTINDALIDCIKALGGSKQVGSVLWPEKAPDAAQRALLDCLNDERPAKLSPEQVLLLILRLARERGCHVGMQFLCENLGYAEPTPIEPRDELADLLRQYLSRREMDAGRDARLERLLQQHLAPRAAA